MKINWCIYMNKMVMTMGFSLVFSNRLSCTKNTTFLRNSDCYIKYPNISGMTLQSGNISIFKEEF